MSASKEIPPTPSEADYLAALTDEPPLESQEPLELFRAWLAQARASEPNDANAMALATVDAELLPDVRMVLLKNFGSDGMVFYSNSQSAKGQQLLGNPQAALLFHWKSLRRQVRLRGAIVPVSDEEADAYFVSRARDSRLGAWASDQSREMPDRLTLARRVAEASARFADGAVPRPAQWVGYRLNPVRIEFWRDRPYRLHERLEFYRPAIDAAWAQRRLFP